MIKNAKFNSLLFNSLLIVILIIMFFLAGIGAIIGSVFIRTNEDNFIINGIEINAVIYLIETHGTGEDKYSVALVEYEVNGIKYKSELDQYSRSMREGQIIRIRYVPDDPNKITYAKNEYIGFWIFLFG